MQMRAINPNDWLGAFHINHAIEVTAGQRVVYCSGQTSNGPDGALLHEGDIVGQFQQAWNNLLEVLAAADMQPSNIVRLNFYTTDVDGFMASAEKIVPLWAEAGCKPVATLLGVTRLFMPGVLIEIEATAVA
jgi:enamine deaminase RidA (YjgF/YER057c/UK114 family)